MTNSHTHTHTHVINLGCKIKCRFLAPKSKSKLYYDRQSVGQSVLVSDTQLGPATNFFHSQFLFDSFGFIDVGRPLWREVGSVLFSFCRSSPAQHFSDLSPTGLMSIVYRFYFWDSLNQEGQVPVVISPRNKVAQLYPRALDFYLKVSLIRHTVITACRELHFVTLWL
jgi:hypothetical protein